MDRLQSMRTFQTVVDEGGFAAAARKLVLAPSAVTRLMADLEQSLGARLLNRSTRSISLTQAGEDYLARLRVILAEIEDAEAVVQTHAREMVGTLRVLATSAAASHIVAPAVTEFQKLHPAIVVEIHASESPAGAIEDFDLTVLRQDPQLDANVVVRPILESDVVLCASPDYLRKHGVPNTPAELSQHRILRLRSPGARLGPLQLIDPTQGDRKVEVEVKTTLTANDTDVLFRATVEGGGISSHSLPASASQFKEGRLQRVLSPWITDSMRVVAAMPSRKFLPQRTRAFLDLLVECSRRRLLDLTKVS